MRRIYVPSSESDFAYAIHVDAKLDDSSSESSRKAYQELLDEFKSLKNVFSETSSGDVSRCIHVVEHVGRNRDSVESESNGITSSI